MLQFIHRDLDIVTAGLLLTGQITIGAIFILPDSFGLSLSGPIFGGARIKGKSLGSALTVDSFDIITALLLIFNQINVFGTFITSKRFNLIVGGPIFGLPRTVASLPPEARRFNEKFRKEVFKKFM